MTRSSSAKNGRPHLKNGLTVKISAVNFHPSGTIIHFSQVQYHASAQQPFLRYYFYAANSSMYKGRINFSLNYYAALYSHTGIVKKLSLL